MGEEFAHRDLFFPLITEFGPVINDPVFIVEPAGLDTAGHCEGEDTLAGRRHTVDRLPGVRLLAGFVGGSAPNIDNGVTVPEDSQCGADLSTFPVVGRERIGYGLPTFGDRSMGHLVTIAITNWLLDVD